jgi:hypothetical protein
MLSVDLSIRCITLYYLPLAHVSSMMNFECYIVFQPGQKNDSDSEMAATEEQIWE